MTCRICDAQNLVPNASFEDTVSCPYGANKITDAMGWFSSKGSPDYFNPCANSTTPQVGVPNNMGGHQDSYDGVAYAGLVTYQVSPIPNIYREYISIELNQTLIAGVKYFVSAFIARADTFNLDCATNKFGFRFSTIAHQVPTNALPIDNFSHVHSDAIITDKNNWTWVGGSFLADSNYQYINIGNFYEDANTDTIECPNLQNYIAYYYVDEVCVSTDSLTCSAPVGINELKNDDELILFPNPFTDKINVTVKRNEQLEVSLYDVTSRRIFNQTFTNSTTINTAQLAKGIYLYEVRNKSGVIKQGKVVKD